MLPIRKAVGPLAVAIALGITGVADAKVPNLQLKVQGGPFVSATQQSTGTTVFCPPGTSVIGSGGRLDEPQGFAGITQMIPSDDLTHSGISAVTRAGGVGKQWRSFAYATCGNPAGLVRAQANSPRNSDQFRTAHVSCPTGTFIYGGGASVAPGLAGSTARIVLDGLFPDSNGRGMTVSAHEDGAGVSTSWSLFAYANCAQSQGDLELRPAVSSFDSSFQKSANAKCSPGKKVVGVLGATIGAPGKVVLDDLVPAQGTNLNDQGGVTVTAAEGLAGTAQSWEVVATAICALP